MFFTEYLFVFWRSSCARVFSEYERLKQHFTEEHSMPIHIVSEFVEGLGIERSEDEESSESSEDSVSF